MNVLVNLILGIAVLEVILQNGCSATDRRKQNKIIVKPTKLTVDEVQKMKHSQTGMNEYLTDGDISLTELAENMAKYGFNEKFPILVVRNKDGTYTSLDNRRLAAAKVARVPVYATILDYSRSLGDQAWRFGNAKTAGEGMRYRGRVGSPQVAHLAENDDFNGYNHNEVRIRGHPRDLMIFHQYGYVVDKGPPREFNPYAHPSKSSNRQSNFQKPYSRPSSPKKPTPNFNSENEFPAVGMGRKAKPQSKKNNKPSAGNTETVWGRSRGY